MKTIKVRLEERKKYLLKLQREKEKAVAAAPKGYLRICKHGNKPQYYLRTDPKDYNGIYIRRKDVKIAKKLAQKDYDKKILCKVEKEINAINKC